MAVALDPLAADTRGFIVIIQDTRGRFAPKGSGNCGCTRRGTDTTPHDGLLPCGSNGM